MPKKMSIRKVFASQYASAKKRGNYSLGNIKAQSPANYSVDQIHKIKAISGSRCDYFLLCSAGGSTGIYLVEEKKSNRSKASTIKAQLIGGAKFIAQYLQKNEQFDFLPVLVAEGIAPSERMKMLKIAVSMHGKERKMEYCKIHAPLRKIVG